MKKHGIAASLLAGALFVGAGASLATPAFAETATQKSAAAVTVPAGIYKLDATHAALLWSFKHNDISNYTGRFQALDATLNLDPKHIDKSSIEFSIDPKSVQTSYPADYKAFHKDSAYQNWDEDISRNPDFLNSDKFPNITFKSTKVKQTGPLTAQVTGNLTFLGVTKPVTMNATFIGGIASHPFMKVPAVGFAAEGHFNRKDFGLEPGPVGEEITIRFDGEFVQQSAPAKAN